ncbi:hypothetical protein MM221_06475 [Salipaludibacillus sp. LMS25]|uniref:hypothetical protein n=1 Tax=Salipaludibacillus sp. LMS25 TaxID=2924031 RepID=UPI0020D04808|nr:hypothetical protein [Salipaludibacillus sp. LMS25]UTR16200.1 hypothetical protein MM221_06475 [Salipaludibacillus sp. LMS25]
MDTFHFYISLADGQQKKLKDDFENTSSNFFSLTLQLLALILNLPLITSVKRPAANRVEISI